MVQELNDSHWTTVLSREICRGRNTENCREIAGITAPSCLAVVHFTWENIVGKILNQYQREQKVFFDNQLAVQFMNDTFQVSKA